MLGRFSTIFSVAAFAFPSQMYKNEVFPSGATSLDTGSIIISNT